MNTQTIKTENLPIDQVPLARFADLNLVSPLMDAIAESGYVTPTPIQAQSIPQLLAGHDLLGLAQTGTGKTAAFVLPMLQRMMEQRNRPAPKSMRALILTPTRELAVQIADSIKTYGKHLPLRSTVIFGGVGQAPQVEKMQRGIDFLVATPGRLLDLMNQRHVSLASVEFFVLDEADRMLDMGFIRDIRKVIAALPARRQTLLFSATMPRDVADLANSLLTKPKRVEVVPQSTTAERIDQLIYFVPRSNKRQLLAELLRAPAVTRAIVFTRTKRGADKVSEYLERSGHTSAAIHGNKGQNARQQALASFRNGTVKVLVATDIAARGIDVDGISHVINFELPLEPESYVHRIGRTARAGNAGVALSLCDGEERSLLRDIEKIVRMKLPVVDDHPLALAESSAADNAEQVTLQRAKQIRETRERQQSRGPQQARNGRNRRPGERNDRSARSSGTGERETTGDSQNSPRGTKQKQVRRDERPAQRSRDSGSRDNGSRDGRRQQPSPSSEGESRFEAELRRAQAARGGTDGQQKSPVRQGTDQSPSGSQQRRIDYRSRAEGIGRSEGGRTSRNR